MSVASSRPKALVVAVAVVLAAALGVYFAKKRKPASPPAIMLSPCADPAPGVRRIRADFGVRFDVPESGFTVLSGSSDMPPATLYQVTSKDGAANLIVGYDDDMFNQLKVAFPTFSVRVEQRDIRNAKGQVVGRDRWGYLNSGERWRYVTFSSGDAAGYHPYDSLHAGSLDRILSSACASPRP